MAIACLAGAAGPALVPAAHAQPNARAFHIARGPAAEAIAAFARQADVNVLASTRHLDDVVTNEVAGSYSVEEALARLLANTGLRSRISGNGSVFIMADAVRQPAQAAPPAPAEASQEVVVTGSRLVSRGYLAPSPTTVIGAEEFQLSGAQAIETALMQSPQFLGNMYNATGNGGSMGVSALNMRGLGEQRSLTLVNGRRYTVTGTDSLTDLNTIPAALVKRVEIVTGGSSAVYGSDAVAGVVNFIMRTDFKGVEVTAETRRDAHTNTPANVATLTIGGDLAGRGHAVVSLDYYNRGGILRGAYPWSAVGLADGCVTSASWSASRAGVPLAVPAGQTCAGAGGKAGFVAANSAWIPAGRYYGIPTYGSPQSSPGLDAALAAAGLRDMTSFGITFDRGSNAARPAIDPDDRYNNSAVNYMQTPLRRVMANSFATYRLDSHATAYVEAHASDYLAGTAIAPGAVNTNVLVNVDNPYLSAADQAVLRQLDLLETGPATIRLGTAAYTTTPGDGLAVVSANRRNMDAGLRMSAYERKVGRILAGVRGELSDRLAYDVYYAYARTLTTEDQYGNFSLSRWQDAMLSVNGAPPLLNPFGPDTVSQAALRAVQAATTNAGVNEQRVMAGNLTGTAFQLPDGPVDVNAGFEWRANRLVSTPDALNATGDVAGQGILLPVAGSIGVKEWYAEARAPVLADAPFARRLALNGAARYSHYDLNNVGGVWTHSIGVEWQPVRGITLRTQSQKAIRAPNIGELYGPRVPLSPVLIDPCSNRVDVAAQTAALRALCAATGVPQAAMFTAQVQPNPQIWTLGGGNAALRPETARTATLGIVLTPAALPNLAVSVDFYRIDLRDAIAPIAGNPQNVFDLCYTVIANAASPYCKAVHRDPATGALTGGVYGVDQSQANMGGIRSAGADLNGHYALDLPGPSRIEITSNWNYTRDYTFTPTQALPALKNQCAGAYGTVCGAPAPIWKGTTRVIWRTSTLTLSLHERFAGAVMRDAWVVPVRQGKTPPGLDGISGAFIKPQHYVDLSFSLRLPGQAKLYGGINNLFAKEPPMLGSGAATWGLGTAPGTYEVFGRTWFLGLSRRL